MTAEIRLPRLGVPFRDGRARVVGGCARFPWSSRMGKANRRIRQLGGRARSAARRFQPVSRGGAVRPLRADGCLRGRCRRRRSAGPKGKGAGDFRRLLWMMPWFRIRAEIETARGTRMPGRGELPRSRGNFNPASGVNWPSEISDIPRRRRDAVLDPRLQDRPASALDGAMVQRIHEVLGACLTRGSEPRRVLHGRH